MESKARVHTWADSVQSFPEPEGKKVSQVQTVDTEKEMTDAENSELAEALRSINAQF